MEIEIALWSGQASIFLEYWLRRFEHWDRARIYWERRNQPGDWERSRKCAGVRDHYMDRINRYVEALGSRIYGD